MVGRGFKILIDAPGNSSIFVHLHLIIFKMHQSWQFVAVLDQSSQL